MTETNAVVHIRRSFMVALLVLVMFAAVCQRHLEMMLHASLSIQRQMQDSCSGREVYDLLRAMRCFPVEEKDACEFQDGYGDGRTYGGKRTHEGIDVMSRSGKRGELTVQSVSEGVVEKVGWLPTGWAFEALRDIIFIMPIWRNMPRASGRGRKSMPGRHWV